MSLRRQILNRLLRWTERPVIARATPAGLRRSLAVKARLFFHGPRGVHEEWRRAGKTEALWLTPAAQTRRLVIFYIHGGGFVFGSPDTHKAMIARLATSLGARAVLPRYALSPEVAFPGAADDVRSAWDALITSGVAPGDVVVGGDSAGGALAFDLLAQICREGRGVPAGLFALSPLVDLTFSGASFRENLHRDVVLPGERAAELAELYLRGHPASDPRASPLFADFPGAPPVWLTVGDTEILRDDSRRMAAHLNTTGIDVTLEEEHDLPHVWPIFHNVLPEARHSIDALAAWITALER
tara:strand:- start:150883 stop:151779 length:897 start_codon:yes stop_codon:yes gene_type:complete